MNDSIWGTRTVLLGEADHGKSTLMGYMYAESQGIDMDEQRRELEEELVKEPIDDYLYSSLVNAIVVETQGGLERFSTRRRNLKDFVVDYQGQPLLISMIDTPGHAKYLSHQEYGATKGQIGVFCLKAEHILDSGFDGSIFDRTRLWFAAHPGLKLIIALTKFDNQNYSEENYLLAKQMIERYIPLSQINSIIPIAIDCLNRTGENIFKPSALMPWYTGPVLIEAISEQHFYIADNNPDSYGPNQPNNPVFSIERSFRNTQSSAGKIWRVFVENGNLEAGDGIQMTSVEIDNGSSKQLEKSVKATVREFRTQISGIEDYEIDDSFACSGSVITLNLKDCYVGKGRVNKKQVFHTDQTIGLADAEPFGLYNRLCVSFTSPEDVFLLKMRDAMSKQDAILADDDAQQRQGELIALLVFGRALAARVDRIEVLRDKAKVYVQLLANRCVTIPDAPELRNLSIFKHVVVRISLGSWDFSYHRATIDYDQL